MSTTNDTTEIIIVAGSNLDRDRCMPEAIRRLRRHSDIVVQSVSSCYESESVGGPEGAPDFWNTAILAAKWLCYRLKHRNTGTMVQTGCSVESCQPARRLRFWKLGAVCR